MDFKNVKVLNNKKNLGIFAAIKYNSQKLIDLVKEYTGVLIFNSDLENINFEDFNLQNSNGITFFPVVENENNLTIGGVYNKILELPIEKTVSTTNFDELDISKLDYFYGAAYYIDHKSFLHLIDENFMDNFLYFEELYLKSFALKNNIEYCIDKKIMLSHKKSLSTLSQKNGRYLQQLNLYLSRRKYLNYKNTPYLKIIISTLFISLIYLFKLNPKSSNAAFKSL